MFNRSGDSGYPCLIDIERTAFNVSLLRMIFAVGFCKYLVLG